MFQTIQNSLEGSYFYLLQQLYMPLRPGILIIFLLEFLHNCLNHLRHPGRYFLLWKLTLIQLNSSDRRYCSTQATCLFVPLSICPSRDNEFQEVFPSYQMLKMVLVSLQECSIVKVKHFNSLVCFLGAIAALEMVMCVSQFVLDEFLEVCITKA